MSRLFVPFVLLQYLLPQHALSRFVALFAEGSFLKNALIKTFIRRYRVDLSEALISDPAEFASFNAFFTRELKPSARSIEDAGDSFVCPADGTISQLGNISNDQLLQAKGRHYSVVDLLGGDTELAEQFLDGSFATIYLSPRDYHRVHMPLAGRLDRMIYIPGKLFSVNAQTTAAVPNLFARNERVVCLFQSDAGPMALILVGAMMDIYSAIVVVVPLIAPIAAAYGIDPVHLGIVFLANMELGYLMPPMGENLFLSSYRFDKPLTEVYRSTLPYTLLLLGAVLLITYVPGMTLWLVRIVFGPG